MSTTHQKRTSSTSSTAISPETKPQTSRPHWIAWVAVVGGILVLCVVGLAGFAYQAEGRTIARGVIVAGQDVGGQTSLQAIATVQGQMAAFTHGAFHFQLNGKDTAISAAATSSSDNSITLDLVSLDVQKAVSQAYDFGRTGSVWTKLRQRTSALLGHRHQFGTIIVDTGSLRDLLHQAYVDQEKPAVDAGLVLTGNQVSSITDSANGQSVDYTSAIKTAVQKARQLDTSAVPVALTSIPPAIPNNPNLLALARAQVPAALTKAPITLTAGDQTWTIKSAKLAQLLGFDKTTDGTIRVGFDDAKTAAYLKTVAADVTVAPQNAKLALNNGKIEEFQTSVVGKSLDTAATIVNMSKAIFDEGQSTAQVAVTDIQPVSNAIPHNDLGVVELVAEATTNFHGSPTNRRFNLTYGAKLLNGLLIAPGETFSLVKALGVIDQAHGWKPELVIKGTDITPEFGGGLCQVATTLFRAALNAGLPINERTNHSLRIRYYEPPVGLDATIYDPKPDLKFTNDYQHYLLLETEVVGNDITFRFYGTKEGRVVDIPTPKVFNQTGIPPTKNIEVTDLKPGQKECQTPGHPGADAIAVYTVTKADGTKVVQTFKSHYNALPVICRIGKATPKPSPAPVVPPAGTNTNVGTNTNTSAT